MRRRFSIPVLKLGLLSVEGLWVSRNVLKRSDKIIMLKQNLKATWNTSSL